MDPTHITNVPQIDPKMGWQPMSPSGISAYSFPEAPAQDVSALIERLDANEEARLAALELYGISDETLGPTIDDLVQLAARSCSAPIALVSVIARDRILYRSGVGTDLAESARGTSFCSWTILAAEQFVVRDTLKDHRFRHSEMVMGAPRARFYAGAPLVTPEGYALGTLCIMDRRPRDLTQQELGALATLAGAVMAQLELRRNSRTLRQALDEREGALEQLAAVEERYKTVVRNATEGFWDWDLDTNQVHFCPRWKAMLGFEESEISSSPEEWFNRVHPEDVEEMRADLTAHIQGQTPHFDKEYRMIRRDGAVRWMITRGLASRDPKKGTFHVAGSNTDVTEQKEQAEQLLHDAHHDVLTGLPNRTVFIQRLNESIELARQPDGPLFAVLFVDLDRFKVINESLGHQIGDQLLIVVARRMETSLRPEDMVTRLGGDEFGIILGCLKHLEDAMQAAERLQKDLTGPFNLDGNEIFASVSIGIAHPLSPTDTPEEILRNADTAMYRAKEQGRGRCLVFETGMHEKAVALLELETDLRRAFSRDEFRVFYQPIVAIEDWSIAGFEALLRWEHPQRGFISPMQFITVAEETGMIVEIGLWVMRQACQQLKIWQDRFPSDPPLSMSVNLSGKQVLQPELIQEIKQVLIDTGIAPGSLKIEITESVIIQNIQLAASVVKELKALGIQISLDDFGTGYSSLSHLHDLPIDTLKIDRSFVTRMDLPKNAEIVRTIVTLAANLGMDVVAEGVETREQVMHLIGLNCEYLQGYLLSRPLASHAIEELIQEVFQVRQSGNKNTNSPFAPVNLEGNFSLFGESGQSPHFTSEGSSDNGMIADAGVAESSAVENANYLADLITSSNALSEPPETPAEPEDLQFEVVQIPGSVPSTRRTGIRTNRRRFERFQMALTTGVIGHNGDEEWLETAETVDVSAGGLKIVLQTKVTFGMVLKIALPMPGNLRAFGDSELPYEVYAIVRRIEPLGDDRSFVALEFIGEEPPEGFAEAPWAQFTFASWSGADRRIEPRREEFRIVLVEYLDAKMQPIRRDPALTENVSRKGMRLRLSEKPPAFAGLKVIAPDFEKEATAWVRNSYIGSDGFQRLCLQFEENAPW